MQIFFSRMRHAQLHYVEFALGYGISYARADSLILSHFWAHIQEIQRNAIHCALPISGALVTTLVVIESEDLLIFVSSADSACLKWFTSRFTCAASCFRSKNGNANDWLQILHTCLDAPPSRDRLWMEAMWYTRWFFWTNVLSHSLHICWRSLRWVR